jgi:hypothetical protein
LLPGPAPGRIHHRQRLALRAFVAAGGQPLSTAELLRACYPRAATSDNAQWRYRKVREAAALRIEADEDDRHWVQSGHA